MSKLVKDPTELSEDNFVNNTLPNRPKTRSQTQTKVKLSINNKSIISNKSEYLSNFENQNMAQAHLSLETLLK